MQVSIVIPTYNERENISKLMEVLERIFHQDKEHTYSVVVVDGKSPDGTADIVRRKASEVNYLHLIEEEKKTGLGAAYILGMRYALENLNPDALIEMDADFQHDPNDIPRLVSKLAEGADYVVGSRYIAGGSIPKEWEFYRKFLSFAGNLFSRIVLGLYEIHDITSGYRISRAEFIRKIKLEKLDRRVYAYKIQLLFEMHELGAVIKEIPIKFGLRDRGISKMPASNIIGSLILVLTLRYNKNKSFVRFLIVGSVGLTVQTGVLFFLTLVLGADPKISLVPAFLLAVITTFTLNNIWSFREREIKDLKIKVLKFGLFVVVSLGSFFIQRTFIALTQTLTKNNVYITLFIGYPLGVVVGLVWNYTFYSRIIWKKGSN